MVRGILKNGTIHPIDPLPPHWREGQRISMDEESPSVDPIDDPAAIARWALEMSEPESAASAEDTIAALRAINEHRAQQKEMVRRQMELD